MKRRRSKFDRSNYVGWGMAGLFVVAAVSQAKVQIFDSKAILRKAQDSHRFATTKTEVARRGRILSSDGKALAAESDSYQLVVEFGKVPHSDAFFVDLSNATGIPASEFSQLADAGVKSKTWSQMLTPSQQADIQALKTRWRANGVSTGSTGQRDYPLGVAASCIVGMYGPGSKLGLELTKDDVLKGSNGETVGLIDRSGAFLPTRISDDSKPKVDGKDLTLTIDSDLQVLATSELKQAVESNKADKGAAIVYDPKTGDILAMANWPSFDPDGGGGGPVSDYNPNTMARLEPGSMFKILTLAEALDTHAIEPNWTGNCSGEMSIGTKVIHCDSHHGNRAHGVVDTTKAIAVSCNISAARWAMRIQREPFRKFLRALGLFKEPGLGLPNELPGNYYWDDAAEQLQLAINGFGQAMNVTPVRLASAFAMLANGGLRMEPRLIKKVGDVEQPIQPAGQVVSPETAQQVLKCMEAVIESDSGTGKTLRIPGYRLGGKTGTAQKIGKGVHGYVSNFIGFVPANEPKVAILVMIDNPKGGAYYGATVAGPVFKSLAQAVIRRYAIPATEPIAASPRPAVQSVPRADRTPGRDTSKRAKSAKSSKQSEPSATPEPATVDPSPDDPPRRSKIKATP